MSDTAALAVPETRRPLTTFLWMLCGYLVVDATLRIVSVAQNLGGQEELTRRVLQDNFEGVMFATLDLLLCLQVLLRTLAARIFGSILFVFHLGSTALRYAVRTPETWLSLNSLDRLQVMGHLILCSIALVLLNRRPCRQVLRN